MKMGWLKIAAVPCAAFLVWTTLSGAATASTADGLDAFEHGRFADALKDLKPAAAHGDADAEYTLGKMYAAGTGVKKDPDKATEYFRKAAVQGHAKAQQSYGSALMLGDGVKQNMVDALKWFIISSRMGNAEAARYVSDVSKFMTQEMRVDARAKATEWIEAFEKKHDEQDSQ